MVKRANPLAEDIDEDAPNTDNDAILQPSPFNRAQLATAKRARKGPPRIPRPMNAQSDDDEEHQSSDENQPTPARIASMHKPAPVRIQLPTATGAGIIKLVKVHNFMTYKDAEIKPGPRLNLVLGPNGTGKSSLVCAICVGLGGGTKLLGRADKLNEFIRRGQTESWTEITLTGEANRDYVIRREMRLKTEAGKESVDSVWKINGVHKREKDVQELMTRFNIQLDNLCQFLPQDKVVEFARLNPSELLKETEKAIGDASMHQQHEDLITKREALKQDQLAYDKRKEGLEQQKAKQAQQERDYERFQQRRNLMEEISMIEGKALWVDFKAKKDEFAAAQLKHRAAKEELSQIQPKRGDPSAPIKKLQNVIDKAKAEAKKANDAFKRFDREGLSSEENLKNKDMELEEKLKERAGLAERAAAREARIAQGEAQLVKLRDELAALPERLPAERERRAEELRQEIIQLENQMQDTEAGISEVEGQLRHNDQNIQKERGKLRQISDAKLQKLDKLKTRNIQRAYQWLNNNRSRFQGPIYGPLLLELDVKTPEAAPFLEMALPFHWFSAFIVTNPDDSKLLSSELRGLECPATVLSVETESVPVHQDGPAQQYERFGIYSTLDQQIITSPRVLRGLCDVAWLHTKYIGTQQTDDMMEQLNAARLAEGRAPLRDVFTPRKRFQVSTSRYNRNAVSTDVMATRRANLLAAGGGAASADTLEKMQRLITKLEETRSTLEQDRSAKVQERQQIMDKLASANEEQAAINNERRKLADRRRHAQNEISKVDAKLAGVRREGDPRDREPEINSDIQAILGETITLAKALARKFRAQTEAFQEAAGYELRAKEAELQKAALEELHRAQQHRIRALEEQVRQLAAEEARLKSICLAVQDRLQDKLGLDGDRMSLPAAMKRAFEQLPEQPEELEEMVQTKMQQMSAIVVNNPGVAKEYEDRKQLIDKTSAELAVLEQQLVVQRAAIATLKQQWLPQLVAITDTINATFSANFQHIGCAGEVVLKQADNDDFANYAMEIRVKFRESERLQVLDAKRQSGGERSVSTILYLISLQDVTVTPFRVVDEINQGMDPNNERRVFMLLVNASCRDGTPQCFLLTPKLLPDLPFTDHITVLNIFNGTQIDDEAVRMISNVPLYGNRLARLEAAA